MLNKIILAAAGMAIAATAVFAENHRGPHARAIDARQAHMKLYAFNLGVLGRMAKGEADYDAEAAGFAAANLVALTKMNQANFWPQGSDTESAKGTRALPKIWQDFPGVMSKNNDMAAAAEAMNASAGAGLDKLQASMGALGGTCGACHKAYRQPK